MTVIASASRSTRSRCESNGSPTEAYSGSSHPAPIPHSIRPPESRSMVATSLASVVGARKSLHSTRVPTRSVVVTAAAAAQRGQGRQLVVEVIRDLHGREPEPLDSAALLLPVITRRRPVGHGAEAERMRAHPSKADRKLDMSSCRTSAGSRSTSSSFTLAGQLDHLAPLVDHRDAPRAHFEVSVDGRDHLGRQRAFEVVRHHLDKLLTGHVGELRVGGHRLGRGIRVVVGRSDVGCLEIGVEGRADGRSGPVEQHSLIGLRDVQNVAHVVGRPTVDVAQADDHPLRWEAGPRWPIGPDRGSPCGRAGRRAPTVGAA